MSGLDNILSHIVNDAKVDGDKIINEANEKSRKIIDNANEKANMIKREMHKKSIEKANDYKTRKINMALLEFKKEILSKKQEYISKSFDLALKKVLNMDVNEYKDYLYNSILGSIESGDEEVVVNKRDRNLIDPTFVNKINQYLGSKGLHNNIRLSEKTANILGGFILMSDEVEIDNSFDTIIHNLKEKMEIKIAQILFKD